MPKIYGGPIVPLPGRFAASLLEVCLPARALL